MASRNGTLILNARRGLLRYGGAIGIALGLIHGVSGCNNYQFSNDPLGNLTIADIQLETFPAVLDFGQVSVNAGLSLQVTLRNRGERALRIDSLTIDRSSRFELEGETLFTLDPLSQRAVTIWYRPTGFEAASANLVIESSDPVLPRATVGLAGRCDPPRLDISPLVFDFGSLYVGCAISQPLYVRNLGGSTLSLSKLSLVSTSSELALDLDGASLPLEIPAMGEKQVMVTYSPLDARADSATLKISSNDPDRPTLEGEFGGVGVLTGLVRDVWNVSDNGKVDILFVVDNSGSMEDNQYTLTNNFDNFYRILKDLELDWQIGVVTTDNAALQGIVKIITPETPDVQQTFSDNALVGTSGSGTEMGLEFAYQALAEPMLSGQNRGFLRQDAGLRVIVLSDEEDQSPRSVDYYVSYLQSLKVTPGLVTLSAISGDVSGCSTQCGSADPASRYAAAVRSSDGVQASICDCDFINALEVLAEESVVFQDTFPLTQTPIESTIQVEVDSRISSDWHYDETLNSVVFNSELVTPQNGETVVVTYELNLTCGD